MSTFEHYGKVICGTSEVYLDIISDEKGEIVARIDLEEAIKMSIRDNEIIGFGVIEMSDDDAARWYRTARHLEIFAEMIRLGVSVRVPPREDA